MILPNERKTLYNKTQKTENVHVSVSNKWSQQWINAESKPRYYPPPKNTSRAISPLNMPLQFNPVDFRTISQVKTERNVFRPSPLNATWIFNHWSPTISPPSRLFLPLTSTLYHTTTI